MNRNRMKQIILEYIKNNDSTSFVEIENVFEEQGLNTKVTAHIPVATIRILYFGWVGMKKRLTLWQI